MKKVFGTSDGGSNVSALWLVDNKTLSTTGVANQSSN
jgi:hypothetical protein